MKLINYIKKHKKSVSAICTVLFTVLGGGYILAHLLGGFSDRLTITPATIANENTYEIYDAYIFRDEQVISSRYSGYRLDLCSDGEMAGISTEYARVYENSCDEETAKRLDELDYAIELLKNCCKELNSSGIVEAKNVLKQGYESIVELLGSGDANGALVYREPIKEALLALEINTGSGEKVAENIALIKERVDELEAEKDQIIASLGANYESLAATKTGYYYSGIDGFETVMSSADIGEKTLDGFFDSIDALSRGEKTEVANAAGRMVYDPHWYAAVAVDMQIAVKYMDEDGSAKGGAFTVGFYDGDWNEIEMELERVVSSPEHDRAILLFSSSVMDVGFDGGRIRRVRIHTGEYEGYRVPLQALRLDKEGESGVYILTYGTVEWRKVEEIYRGETFALVAIKAAEDEDAALWLALNDSLIVEGRDLYDGKTVD